MEKVDTSEGIPGHEEQNERPPGSEPVGGARLISFIPEVPRGASRILDFGCGNGDTLMQLKNESDCSELFGVEIKAKYRAALEDRLDGVWIADLGEDGAGLGDAYRDFFNYMLILDVVEHLYDPWYMIPKLSQYLAPDGLMILSVPNMRFWGIWYHIIFGRFPYGQGGLMNEEHIRWFTCDGMKELLLMSGLDIVKVHLAFPPDTDVDRMKLRLNAPIEQLEMPPVESAISAPKVVVRLPNIPQINAEYPYFLANKLIFVCKRRGEPVTPEHLDVGALVERRKRLAAGRSG